MSRRTKRPFFVTVASDIVAVVGGSGPVPPSASAVVDPAQLLFAEAASERAA